MRHKEDGSENTLKEHKNKDITFRLYDPWEARFHEEKRYVGTAE